MTATRKKNSTKHTPGSAAPVQTPALYLAFELGASEWKIGFSTGPADNPRLRTMGAGNLTTLAKEIALARHRFGLPDDAPVRSCYEAGRDGFWLARYLQAQGIDNQVIDSASIEVPRRARRCKTDRLDATKLLSQLIRWHHGEKKAFRVVQVPSVADEDRRQLHRDLLEMKAERTQHVNRIKGLLASCGVKVSKINDTFPSVLVELRMWDGQAIPADLQQRLLREHERWQFVDRQVRELGVERAKKIRTSKEESVTKVRKLLTLKGIGVNSAWLYVMELFGWRQIKNRKQVGALAGLTPTPYNSGDSIREQGISKAGNRRLRTMAVEIAWCWLRHQPQSGLSQWYQVRFGKGNARQRRVGIVAVARKLLVALWKYLEMGEVPSGAMVVDWRTKVHGRVEAGIE